MGILARRPRQSETPVVHPALFLAIQQQFGFLPFSNRAKSTKHKKRCEFYLHFSSPSRPNGARSKKTQILRESTPKTSSQQQTNLLTDLQFSQREVTQTMMRKCLTPDFTTK